MAIYDLKCDECGEEFEKFVTGFLKDEDRVCPECGSREISQRYTGVFGVGSSSCGTGGCSSPPGGSFG